MACYRPLDAWQGEDRRIVFRETELRKELGFYRELKLPCGRCIGCRATRVRTWATRCVHEAQMSKRNCFITLTYSDENYIPSLEYGHYQEFMHRLRAKHRRDQKKAGEKATPVRYFMCGEYGDTTLRPHYHALLFGLDFPDLIQIGENLFRSPTLERLWTKGFSSVGTVNYQTAAYVAGYAMKKLDDGDEKRKSRRYSRVHETTGELTQVQPEFGHMSLKPGIGYTWFQKYWQEVFKARDGVMFPGGRTVPPPRYYKELLETIDMDLVEKIETERYEKAIRFKDDCTRQRLETRELIAKDKLKKRKESKL